MNAYHYEDVMDTLKNSPPIGIPPIPPHLQHPEEITKMGNTILWVVFGIMLVFSAIFVVTSQRVAYRYRLLHVTTLLVNVIAAISYFAMATGIGKTFVHSEHRSDQREIYYARYIDWALTTPLLLLDLTLLAGLPIAEVILVAIADEIMIITGLIAALHPSLRYRWGFYAFSCAAFVYVLYSLIGSARSYAFIRSPKVGSLYNQISLTLIVVWTLYPIAFAFAEGTGRISADQEVLWFGILDVIAKPIWGLWLLLAIPEEGHVLLPESFCAPAGSVSGGGYGAIASEPRAEEA